jgi:hypothetical protein
MDNYSCKPVKKEDIEQLTKISIKAFHSDNEVGAPGEATGPRRNDSI